MTASVPLLEIRDLGVRFGDHVAVAGVSISVQSGQFVAVVGESGSGKSLTALSILRLLPEAAHVHQGEILLHGTTGAAPRNLLAISPRELRRVRGGEVSMIFQEPMTSLNPVFTIAEQITEAARLHAALSSKAARAAAIASLTDVGIADAGVRMDEYPHQWSGGMRQRAMIAMALISRPRLLIADEPTTALDVAVQSQVLDLLERQRAARGLGLLLITHDLGLVARRADWVHVMYAGQVVECGPARALLARPVHPYTTALLASRPDVRHRRARLGVPPVRSAEVACGGSERFRAWWPEDVGGSASRLLEIEPSHHVRVVEALGAMSSGMT